MNRLKILHYPLEVRSRGMEMYMAEHWRFMDRTRFVCDFVTFSESATLEPLLREDGAQVHYIPFAHREGQALLDDLETILKTGNYDVLHLHLRRWTQRDLAVLELAQRLGVPKILLHAHCAGIDEGRRAEHEQARAQFKLSPGVLLCACSARAGTFMFGTYADEMPVHILKNAIDTVRFSYAQGGGEADRTYFETIKPAQRTYVMTVARMDDAQKNLSFAMEVIRRWSLGNPEKYWTYRGGVIQMEQYQTSGLTAAQNYSSIKETWLIPKYMHVLQCLLHPSFYEGVPRVLIEAQAAGMPVLASEEAAQDVPRSELLYTLPLTAPADVWAEQLGTLVENQPHDRGCALELLRAQGYDVRQAVQCLQKLYEEGNS